MKQQHNVRPAIRRVLQATAIVTAAALTLAGCSMGAPSSDTGSSDGKLTVWVMQADQSEATIKAINDQFTKETGVEVSIQNQQWKDISTKNHHGSVHQHPPTCSTSAIRRSPASRPAAASWT